MPARAITDRAVRQQAQERTDFLRANARFQSVRLVPTLCIPGKVARDGEDFAGNARSELRQIQNAALLYEQQLRVAKVQRLLPDELVQIYSY